MEYLDLRPTQGGVSRRYETEFMNETVQLVGPAQFINYRICIKPQLHQTPRVSCDYLKILLFSFEEFRIIIIIIINYWKL